MTRTSAEQMATLAKSRRNDGDMLTNLAFSVELFHTADGTAFADLMIDAGGEGADHGQFLPLRRLSLDGVPFLFERVFRIFSGHTPTLDAHNDLSFDRAEVSRSDDTPGMTFRSDEDGPFEELDAVKNEIIRDPFLVLLRLFEGVEEVATATEQFAAIEINA